MFTLRKTVLLLTVLGIIAVSPSSSQLHGASEPISGEQMAEYEENVKHVEGVINTMEDAAKAFEDLLRVEFEDK